jgi:hypothetical protein
VEFTDSEAPLAFNVNFHAGGNAAGLLGVVGGPGETWNQGTTSASNLIDSTGTVASSVNVSGLPSGGSTTSAGLSIFGANRNFFGKGADTTISITGLVPNAAYDLYIYALSHTPASWGDITSTERAAGDFVTTNTVVGSAPSQFLDNAIPGTDGSTFIANGNYVAFESIISDGSGNISVLVDAYDGPDGNPATNDGDTRLHVNGLQIRPRGVMPTIRVSGCRMRTTTAMAWATNTNASSDSIRPTRHRPARIGAPLMPRAPLATPGAASPSPTWSPRCGIPPTLRNGSRTTRRSRPLIR